MIQILLIIFIFVAMHFKTFLAKKEKYSRGEIFRYFFKVSFFLIIFPGLPFYLIYISFVADIEESHKSGHDAPAKTLSDSIHNGTGDRSNRKWWDNLEDQWKDAFRKGYLHRYSYHYYMSRYRDNSHENYKEWRKNKEERYIGSDYDIRSFPDDYDLLEILSLNKLDFPRSGFSNLSGLYELSELETLIVNRNNYLTIVDEALNLDKLVYLDLSRSSLLEIPGLINMTNLSYADFSFNKISKIPDLTALEKLEYLNLRYNLITSDDLNSLPKSGALRYLNLRHNEIDIFEVTDGFDSLKYLDLSRNNAKKINRAPRGTGFSLDKIDPIKINIDNKKLKELICEGIGLTSLNDINLKNTSVEYLSVQFNNIKDFNGIESINGLRSINFSYNKIKEIALRENIIGIIYLDVSHNSLENLSEINKLPNLIHLNIASNRNINLEGIENLRKLEYLDLSHNHLKDIKILEFMTTLRHLNISYNQLKDIKAVLNLTNLFHLDLSHNFVTEIKGLRRLKNLSYINLSGGSITKIDELLHLSSLDTLVMYKSSLPEKFENQAEIDSIVNKLNLKLYIDNYEEYKRKILKLGGGF